jgi:SAM-dependent methyltransferase
MRFGSRSAPLARTDVSADPLPLDEQAITDEAVTWACRLLAGREPTGPEEIALHKRNGTLGMLRAAFLRTPELAALLAAATQERPRFAIPAFLLRQPADSRIPFRFREPSLAAATSQFATAAQFAEPAFAETITAMDLTPTHHRKLWEHAYIAGILDRNRLFKGGKRAIGFGCGKERIPAYLAARGVDVLATDAPVEASGNQGWSNTNQYAAEVADLFFPRVVDRETFDRRVSFRHLDMNAIPEDLAGQFDACWSACSLEHLGSLQHGLDFIENSLSVLKPNGIAVHTTEFNLTSDEETVESPGLSVYRRRDIESLIVRLIDRGHRVLPLNLHPGLEPLDEVIDIPPFGDPHLKLSLGRFTVTSIGIAVRKAAQ